MPGAGLASCPKGVFAATAALSMSPVARWHRQCSSFILGDCVPFPQPGGPAEHSPMHMTIVAINCLDRGSENSEDRASVQRWPCQITYEYHVLLWFRRTFNSSLDLLDKVLGGDIF
jgi:hypothetical protein